MCIEVRYAEIAAVRCICNIVEMRIWEHSFGLNKQVIKVLFE